jgi:hypothetical protein
MYACPLWRNPLVGRMLSPDNYVQSGLSDNYNRYSYVMNNPMKYSDPSGEVFGWDDVAVFGAGFAIGYVSSGIKTGDWGWSSVGKGALTGVMFELGYLTCGGSAAALSMPFAGSCNAAVGTYAANYIVGSAISMAASSVMPSIQIYSDENFSVSISPAIIYGGGGFGLGANLNFDANINGFVGGVSVGFTAYGNYGPSNSSFIESRVGASFGYIGKNFGFVGSYNSYGGGGFGQETAGVTVLSKINGDWASLTYENDWMPLVPGEDQGDRYRSAAMRGEYKGYSAGFNLFTGNPNSPGTLDFKERTHSIDENSGRETYNGGTANLYHFGGAYVGYGNYRVGVQSEYVRHGIQNRFAHDLLLGGEPKWFGMTSNSVNPYFSYQTRNGYSVW